MIRRLSLLTALAVPAASALAHGHGPYTFEHVRVEIREGHRIITSDGLPDHEPGRFPNAGNPNRITEQEHVFRAPLTPTVAEVEARPRGKVLAGVALNGVPFDPGTAERWSPDGRVRAGGGRGPAAGERGEGRRGEDDRRGGPPRERRGGGGPGGPGGGWAYEALTGGIDLGLDEHHAHVQPGGTYHYHALPTGLYERLAGRPVRERPDRVVLVGWAADGYPIYGPWGHATADDPASELRLLKASYRVKPGARPAGEDNPPGDHNGTFTRDWEYVEGLGDLDEHNGRFGVTPEFPGGTYHYVLTYGHPFVPRTLRGVPDASFVKGPPAGGGGRDGDAGERRRGGPPRDGERRPPRDR